MFQSLKSLSCSADYLDAILVLFLLIHKCKNQGCKKFSYLKCQDCRISYYCGKECQAKHWSIHKEMCRKSQDSYEKQFLIPKLLQKENKNLPQDQILPFEVFFKEVSYKVFESYYESLKTPTFSYLFVQPSPFASRDDSLSLLVKRRGIISQSWNSLKKQNLKAYGKDWKCRPLHKLLR